MRHLSLVASAIAAGTGVIYIGFLIKQGMPVEPLTVVVVTAAIAALRGIPLTPRGVGGWIVVILLAWSAVLAALLIPVLS